MSGVALTEIDDGRARRNVVVLATAGALAGALPSINVAFGPLAGHDLLGQDKSLATLPVTAFVVGTACGTVPAAMLMRRFGRRAGAIAGAIFGATGAMMEAGALAAWSFPAFVLGAFLCGFSSAFVQQYRFAAADAASAAFRPRAISLVLTGGIVAAILGPQTAIHAADLLAPIPYAGAYVGGAALCLLAVLALLFLDIPRPPARRAETAGRPLSEIVLRPDFLVAVGCAASAYALMSFVMTAAPLAMVMHHHHQNDAVLGIQWHVLAMFGPSFFTGSLIARFGAPRIIAFGLILLIGCAAVGLTGVSVGHFWLSLILLGLGWNFGFIGGTTLVTRIYRPEEKERVQAVNDFVIFGVVAFASFSSGEILLIGGWNAVNIIALPVALVSLAALFWQMARRPRLA
jgi:MFS family permease